MANHKWLYAVLVVLMMVCLSSCRNLDTGSEGNPQIGNHGLAIMRPETGSTTETIEIQIGSTVLTATLADNSSARAFFNLLEGGEISIGMHDYGDFEKVGGLGQSLVRNDEQITTSPGDVILYQDNQITIYYDTNTWSFTRLGRINGVTQDELRALLGAGDVTVTFRLHSEKPTGNKVLVAYFSATGRTETIAGHVKASANADMYEIVPTALYTSADLNYSDSGSRTSREQNDSSARPAISGDAQGFGQYDVIFLGYPIWHGQAPRIISTFLESHDFSGKTVIPFCTSASSGIGSSDTNLRKLAPEAQWLPGKRFSGSSPYSEVSEWVAESLR